MNISGSIKWVYGGNMQRPAHQPSSQGLLAFCLVTLLLCECVLAAKKTAKEAPPKVVFPEKIGYPQCWIRYGECLDNNEPPLKEAVKPQINHNVVGESIFNVTSVDACSEECHDNADCR